SLIPLHGSHNFTTTISEQNKVDFTFTDINLPYTEDYNDGFVAFKIKTNPALVVGDTFSNAGSIYFDFNYPVNTDAYTTVIEQLGNDDFAFEHALTIYPNPANSHLNIHSKRPININS